MPLLGTLLRNRRPDEATFAWNQPNLAGPDTLDVTSHDFEDGASLPERHAGRRVGGENLSPHLAWSEVPPGTADLLLVIEDVDVPVGSKPAMHTLALIDGAELRPRRELIPGALAKAEPAPGVTLLRSFIGRGYHGPEPVKGHGPHRYVFEVFALGERLGDRAALARRRPWALVASLRAPVLARGRITGLYER